MAAAASEALEDRSLLAGLGFQFGIDDNGGLGIRNTSSNNQGTADPDLFITRLTIDLRSDPDNTFFDTTNSPPGTASRGWSTSSTNTFSTNLPSNSSTDGQEYATMTFSGFGPGEDGRIFFDLDRLSDIDGTGRPAGGSVTVTFGSGHTVTAGITTTNISIDGSDFDNRAIGSRSFSAPGVSVSRSPSSGIGYDDSPTESLSWSTSGATSRTAYLRRPSGSTITSSSSSSGSFGISSSTVNTYGLGTYRLDVYAYNQFGDRTVRSTTMEMRDDDTSGPSISLGGASATDAANNYLSWSVGDSSGIHDSNVTVQRLSPSPTTLYSSAFSTGGSYDLNNQPPGTYRVSVSATDNDNDRSGDRSSSSNSRTITITDDDTSAPVVSFTGPSSQSAGAGATTGFNLSESSSSGIRSYSARVYVGSSSTLAMAPISQTFSTSNGGGPSSYLRTLNLSSLVPGNYRVEVTTSNNDLDRGTVDIEFRTISRSIALTNAAPVAGLPSVSPSAISENDLVTVTGSFSDADLNDTHTVVIDWGDGTTANAVVNQSANTYSATHRYLDDGPSPGNGSPSDTYTIRATVTDDDNASDSSVTRVIVNNVAPTLENIAVTSPINENGVATLSADIIDPGTLDAFTLVVNWGDGSANETITILAGSTSFAVTHQYLDDNPTATSSDTYDVTLVSFTDDDGGTAGVTQGGSIFLTGHDIMSHGNQRGYSVVILDYLRGAGQPGEIARSQYDIGALNSRDPRAGVAFGSFQPRSLSSFASPAAFAAYLSTIDVLTIPELYGTDITRLQSYSAEIESFFNAGGDIFVDSSNGQAGYYNFLPPVIGADGPGINSSTGFSPTAAGAAIGITSAMVNGYPTHNRFVNPDSVFTVLETHSLGIVSIGTRNVVISDGGLGSALSVTVNNVAPTVSVSLSDTSIDEDGSTTLSGTITDTGTLDTFTLDLDWDDPLSPDDTQTFSLGTAVLTEAGDGINWDPSTREFSLSHQYLDDNPSVSDADDYTISVVVTDDDTGVGATSTTVTVNNVAPTIVELVNLTEDCGNGAEGEPVTIDLDFTDPGSIDVHTVTINWGDGDTQVIVLPVGDRAISVDHTYAAGGVYYIDVTLEDDDSGVDTTSTTAIISGVNVLEVNGEQVLQVIGTSADDHISINQTGNGQLKVHWDFLGDDPRVFPLADVDRIMSILCEGDDHLTISGKVTLPTIIDAGAGNDHINGGAGTNIILGGDGDDHINGGDARDILIGGNGADRIVGGPGHDLMTGGIYADSSGDQGLLANYDSLLAVQDRWLDDIDGILGGDEDPEDDAVLAAFYAAVGDDEGAADQLTGSSGFDWLLLFEGDNFTDEASNGKGNGGGKGGKK